MMARDDQILVDVSALDEFRSSLHARLAQAQSMMDKLVALGRTAPALGTLPDADYVGTRYQALYDQHLDRLRQLVGLLTAAQDAIGRMAEDYTTTETNLATNANTVGDLVGGVSGAVNGEPTHAG